MNMPTFTFRNTTFYVSYAPELGVFSYGDCREEAINGLTALLRHKEATGEERKNDAV